VRGKSRPPTWTSRSLVETEPQRRWHRADVEASAGMSDAWATGAW